MWYINLSCSCTVSRYLLSFILTMWYINKNNKGWYCRNCKSFILTMWYINKGDVGLQGPAGTFYINYVVYKFY